MLHESFLCKKIECCVQPPSTDSIPKNRNELHFANATRHMRFIFRSLLTLWVNIIFEICSRSLEVQGRREKNSLRRLLHAPKLMGDWAQTFFTQIWIFFCFFISYSLFCSTIIVRVIWMHSNSLGGKKVAENSVFEMSIKLQQRGTFPFRPNVWENSKNAL